MPVVLLACGFLALGLAPLAAPWLQFVLTLAIAKGFAALGVAILLRAGLISIGHAMFYAVGAYAVAFVARAGTTDLVLLLIAGTAASALAGILVGAFVIRYRAIFFAMLNLAISMVLYALLSKFYGLTGGTDGLRLPVPTVLGMTLAKPAFDTVLYYGSLVLMAGVGLAVTRYLASPLGHALSAVHTNELRLEYVGVPTWGVLLIAYAISAALAGIGGVIAAAAIGHVLPEFTYWTASGQLVLVAVLGGIGGVAGPFIGALFLEVLHTVAVGVTDAWNLIVGAVLIAVIVFIPTGLYGLLRRVRGAAA